MPTIRRKLPPVVAQTPIEPIVPQLLNTAKAAAFLGTSKWRLRDLMHKGLLKPVMFGNRPHFDRSDLLGYIVAAKGLAA